MDKIRENKLQNFINARGGETIVRLTKDGKDYIGISKCSFQDPFVKKNGVARALGRAYSNLVHDKAV